MTLPAAVAFVLGAVLLLLIAAVIWIFFIAPKSEHPLSWPSLILLFTLAGFVQAINILCICAVFFWDRLRGRRFRWDHPKPPPDTK
jgi:hypothetical protein